MEDYKEVMATADMLMRKAEDIFRGWSGSDLTVDKIKVAIMANQVALQVMEDVGANEKYIEHNKKVDLYLRDVLRLI